MPIPNLSVNLPYESTATPESIVLYWAALSPQFAHLFPINKLPYPLDVPHECAAHDAVCYQTDIAEALQIDFIDHAVGAQFIAR